MSAKFNKDFFNLRKSAKLYIENTKCHWEKLKASKNGETYHVHGSDDSISLKVSILPKLV